MAAQDVFLGVAGNWTNNAEWSAAAPPSSTADAFIGAGALGVSIANSVQTVVVNSIGVSALSVLTIDFSSSFTATNGTTLSASDTVSVGSGNAGTINVEDDSTLSIGGAFVNSGAVNLGAASLFDFGTLNLIGTVTLSGGGAVNLGSQAGAASTLGAVTGGGLVNVNNLISGAGGLTLTSLDNKAGGVIRATQQFVDDLIVNVSQLSNEGLFEVGTNALLEIGQNNQTRAMTNSGAIEIGYEGGVLGLGAQLLIAGSLTVSGAGAIDMMGVSDAIASDGAPATFTNASKIVATASGQIGDANFGFDDLTFVNSGTVTATGALVTLTLDTGGQVIADSGVLQALNGATLAINSKVDVAGASSGAAGMIFAGFGGAVDLAAAVVNSAFPNSTAGGVVVAAGGVLIVDFRSRGRSAHHRRRRRARRRRQCRLRRRGQRRHHLGGGRRRRDLSPTRPRRRRSQAPAGSSR